MTRKQSRIQRHNRFLDRIWKIPKKDRMKHRNCVACLEDFLDPSPDTNMSHMVTMACDHPIHFDCFTKHAKAYMKIQKMVTVEDIGDTDLPASEICSIFDNEILFTSWGAPCPACRMKFPLMHMSPFIDKKEIYY